MLKNIDIEIKSGQVVALMGPSGSGKSTLIKIISSFLEPTEGKILIDNRPVKVNSPYSSYHMCRNLQFELSFLGLLLRKIFITHVN